MVEVTDNWPSLVYGVTVAAIGAGATQMGVWFTAKGRAKVAETALEKSINLEKMRREDITHDQIVLLLQGQLNDAKTEIVRLRQENTFLSSGMADIQARLTRTRYYSGILRGILRVNNLAVPDIKMFDDVSDAENEKDRPS